MRINVKRTAAVGGAITALALGGTGIALAQSDAPTGPPASADTETENGEVTEEPAYTGSVPAPADADTEGSEADEAAGLEALAVISSDEASAAAVAAVPGTVGAVELGNENGYVVYDVEVTTAGGTVVDVKVDAGNGQVLAQETGDDEGGQD